VWQITACDAATSYGVARILPALSPAATARFLRDDLLPAVGRAGWTLQRVLADRGNEFKAEFAATCAALGIRQTRIKTRHAWTNGFVERLQQTILSEHWRVVFRRHYFTRRTTLDQSLRGFLQRLLRRHGLATRRQRLLVLEHHSARRAGLLTERTRQIGSRVPCITSTGPITAIVSAAGPRPRSSTA
jgi:hypothetical protein